TAKDEEYLYLRMRLANAHPWTARPFAVGFDVRPGGNRGLPGMKGVDPGADVSLEIGRDGTARIEQAASTDPIEFTYGLAHPFLEVRPKDLRPGSGVWDPVRLILNRPELIRPTGQVRPIELADVSDLHWGNWSEPTNLVRSSGDELDLRIPWA